MKTAEPLQLLCLREGGDLDLKIKLFGGTGTETLYLFFTRDKFKCILFLEFLSGKEKQLKVLNVKTIKNAENANPPSCNEEMK